jgi:hypothetical protein
MANVYFELTAAFNANRPTAALASGQAVVFYRIAMMSKDGDWVIRECADACDRVISVLDERGARYRPSAPLDVRWLHGGWSSHFEFADERGRRVRCDFVSRPPRVPFEHVTALFDRDAGVQPLVVDVEALIQMKQTQRAKDYPVIGALAALLPPHREIEFTTDPDRILTLAAEIGPPTTRPALAVAVQRADRRALVLALAEETDERQQRDRRRVQQYETAAASYLAACRAASLPGLPLREAHTRMVEAAGRWLPMHPLEGSDADAQ